MCAALRREPHLKATRLTSAKLSHLFQRSLHGARREKHCENDTPSSREALAIVVSRVRAAPGRAAFGRPPVPHLRNAGSALPTGSGVRQGGFIHKEKEWRTNRRMGKMRRRTTRKTRKRKGGGGRAERPEASWIPLGFASDVLRELFGILLGRLGGLLAVFGPSGEPLGASWGSLGGLLETSWGPLRTSWAPLGALLVHSWKPLELPWGHLGARPKKGGYSISFPRPPGGHNGSKTR
eukprot:415697-Pyramimonas_sp.AAC.1